MLITKAKCKRAYIAVYKRVKFHQHFGLIEC